ncbi:MAG TPA: metal ABC transporter ATP-binding protein [Actinomycetota bacterium]|nr:metal ABC transporter ATP-binding protein [Actinomycetota bacterium]
MNKRLVTLDSVTCHYADSAAAIEDASLTIDRGDFVGVVGPSGSGKTTLLRAVLGVVRPRSGVAVMAPGVRVSYVPQVEAVNWSFPVTVGELVMMGRLSRRRLPWTSAAERAEVAQLLDRLGMRDLEARHIQELSGGQQQRAFIARALMRRPDLLLLDEPTSGVDVRTRHELLHLLGDLNQQGLSVLLTTHDLNGVAAHLPYLVCLNRKVTGAGPPAAVLVPEVLERTYGARMEVLEHGGMRVVVDHLHGAGHPEAPH